MLEALIVRLLFGRGGFGQRRVLGLAIAATRERLQLDVASSSATNRGAAPRSVEVLEQPLFLLGDVQVRVLEAVHLDVDVGVVLDVSLKSLQHSSQLFTLIERHLID